MLFVRAVRAYLRLLCLWFGHEPKEIAEHDVYLLAFDEDSGERVRVTIPRQAWCVRCYKALP